MTKIPKKKGTNFPMIVNVPVGTEDGIDEILDRLITHLPRDATAQTYNRHKKVAKTAIAKLLKDEYNRGYEDGMQGRQVR